MRVAFLSRAGAAGANGSVRALDLVRPPDKDGVYFERLLVPIDFSGGSGAAFATALRIADSWASEVVLFHAAGFDDNDEFLNALGGDNWGRGDAIAATVHHLHAFADTVMPGSAELVRYDAVRDDDAVLAVAEACERHRPSLVIVGLHEPRRHRLRRSKSERIQRAVDVPVLFVT